MSGNDESTSKLNKPTWTASSSKSETKSNKNEPCKSRGLKKSDSTSIAKRSSSNNSSSMDILVDIMATGFSELKDLLKDATASSYYEDN